MNGFLWFPLLRHRKNICVTLISEYQISPWRKNMSDSNQAEAVSNEVVKIEGKITSSSVVTKQKKKEEPETETMSEEYARPEVLLGSTYKISTPLTQHALYVTVNDTVLNQGTINEERRPFEVFINSKNMDHFQWIVALTRVISAVFRKGGDCTFLVEELKAVFDPKGGYFKSGGKFMPSLVAEIGDAIESHLKMIGLIKDDEMDENQKKYIQEKRAQLEAVDSSKEDTGYPSHATLCDKCQTKAMVRKDNCDCCLNCGNSKCA